MSKDMKYASKPVRRWHFKKYCERNGLNFKEFVEINSGETVSRGKAYYYLPFNQEVVHAIESYIHINADYNSNLEISDLFNSELAEWFIKNCISSSRGILKHLLYISSPALKEAVDKLYSSITVRDEDIAIVSKSGFEKESYKWKLSMLSLNPQYQYTGLSAWIRGIY